MKQKKSLIKFSFISNVRSCPMKIIEIDEDLYQYIAANTQSIGESASDILRRLLKFNERGATIQSQAVIQSSSAQVSTVKQGTASNLNKDDNEENISAVPYQTKKSVSEQTIHSVSERVVKVLSSSEFQAESKVVNRFLMILTALYRANPEGFAQATESLQGRTRVYFARDEAVLLQAGTHTKPKQIPETPYWVITNTNTQRKMLMLEGAMSAMNIPELLIEDVRHYFLT